MQIASVGSADRQEYLQSLGMQDEPVLQRNILLQSLLYTYANDKNYSRIIIKSLLLLKRNKLKAGQQINECFEYLLDNQMIELAE